MIPALHAGYLAAALPRWQRDARLLGVAAGGSYRDGTLDEYSDLDLVLVARDADRDAALAGVVATHDRAACARALGAAVALYTALRDASLDAAKLRRSPLEPAVRAYVAAHLRGDAAEQR